jgi:ribosomal protein S18 acetylase RimI-like enzyme
LKRCVLSVILSGKFIGILEFQVSANKVRNARWEELPILIELLKATDLFWEIGDNIDALSNKLRFDPSSIIVLEREKKIIGMAMTTYDPWASFIWHVAVDPKHQGQGLGHLLADEAERRLKSRGTTSVNCYVSPTNKHSLSFFKKRGFKDFYGQVTPLDKPF